MSAPYSWEGLSPAAGEITLATLACVVLLVDLFISDRQRYLTYALSVGAVLLTALSVAYSTPPGTSVIFDGAFVMDPLARTLKLFTLLVVAVVFLYSRDYLRARDLFKGEYYVLGLFATLGILVMISAHSLLSLYLGLELLSLSLYAMVAFDRDNPVAAESAMKYFVLGAIASGCFLYGASMIYGVTGSLDFAEISRQATREGPLNLHLMFAISFLLVGLAFKFGAVPFHMWLPDVYHGSPTCVTLFIGTAAKVASFAMIIRVLQDGLGGLHDTWAGMLVVLSVLSMAIGNVVAIAQTNLKRMLAYSTISHVGFILLGVLAGTSAGLQAAMYYTLVYVVMAGAAFGMIMLLSRRGFEADQLDDFKGLNARSPWYAGLMLIVMFSMAGIPPFVGFYAKLAVLGAVVEVGQTWLAVVGVLFSVIGAFYYLRVVKLMYFDAPESDVPVVAGADFRATLSVNALLVLGLGLFPHGLLALCARVIG